MYIYLPTHTLFHAHMYTNIHMNIYLHIHDTHYILILKGSRKAAGVRGS